MAPATDNGSHGLRHAGDDAFQLTVDYLKQETVEPLRGLGRFLYMGIAGSFFMAGGLLLDPDRRVAPAADRDGHGPDRGLVLGALRGGRRPRHRRDRCCRVAHHGGAGQGEAAGGDRPARGESRSRHRRERADARHDDVEGGKQRTAHHREDLQAAYAQVVGEGEASARAAAPRGLAIAGAVGIVLLTLAFLAGRRRGRAKSAVVEIRRL